MQMVGVTIATVVYSSLHSFHHTIFLLSEYNIQIAAPLERMHTLREGAHLKRGCTQVEKAAMWKPLLY